MPALALATITLLIAGCPAPGVGGGGEVPLSSAKAITAFSFASPPASGVVNENAKTIAITVPYGTDVTALVAMFTTTGSSVKVGSTVQVSGVTANNFSSPITYTVTAADSSTASYMVTATVASGSEKAITAFLFASPAAAGTIDEPAKTIAVNAPYGTNVTALVATFTTTGSSVKVGSAVQVSGTTANDFSSPVIYTVTAADSSTASYTVTVTVALSGAKAITAFSFTSPAATGTIDENAKTIAVTVPNGTDVTALVANFTTTGSSVKVGSAVQVSGTTANDFSSPIIYTVTAADGSTASYTVTVSTGISQGIVTTLAGIAGVSGSADATGSAARFYYPIGITTDNTNLYVVDYHNHTIRKIVISSGAVTTLAGTAGASGSADGTGSAARFKFPQGITTDGTNFYVTDTENYTIRKIVIASGAVTTLAGTAGASGSADGTGSAARFYRPIGIIADGTNLYVADTSNYTIRKIVISSGVVSTVAGSAGISGSTDGTGSAARFYYPGHITMDATNLYVTDNQNNTIRKIVISSGVVSTVAGTARVTGSADGTGSAARFRSPSGITTDGTNLYVADWGNNTIRKIVISSRVVTTVAGSAADFSGSADGTGSAARFSGPSCITTDGTNLYVTDTSNYTIREIR